MSTMTGASHISKRKHMYGLVKYDFLTEYMKITYDAHKILFLLQDTSS